MRAVQETTKHSAAAGEPVYRLKEGQVAVLMAAYNGAKYIKEQLESLRTQTFQDFVCFIHDDGSSDGTQSIAEAFCRSHSAQFVYMGSSKTGGAKYNFMYLLKNVEADYIMFCDQDDVWMPEKIEKTYQAMRQAEAEDGYLPICVFSDLVVVDKELKVINSSFFAQVSTDPKKTSLKELLTQNVGAGCTIMLNSPLRNLALKEDVAGYIYMHDWFVMLLAAAAGKIVFIDEALIYYRQHETNTIGAVHEEKKNFFRKLRWLFNMKGWLEEKKKYFNGRKRNALAVKMCLEAEKAILPSDKYEENMDILQKYLKKYEAPLAVMIIRLYINKITGRK